MGKTALQMLQMTDLLLNFVTIFVETHLNPARPITVTTFTVKRSLMTEKAKLKIYVVLCTFHVQKTHFRVAL